MLVTLTQRLARLLHRLTRGAPDAARTDGTVGDNTYYFDLQGATSGSHAKGQNLNLTWPFKGEQ